MYFRIAFYPGATMSAFNLINPDLPIQNGCSVGHVPQMNSGEPVYIKNDRIDAQLITGNSELTTIDSRYKIGGSTGWERPGSDLP